MDELIRKQDAVELAMEYCPDDDGSVQNDGDLRELLDELENLPPVQPKRGKWVERNPLNSDKCRLIECDQCGKSYIVGFNVPYEHWIDNRNYCEKCGADMRTKETDCDYERAVEQLEHDMLYEPTFDPDDGSM